MKLWIAMDDTKVRHVWRCAKCEDEVNVTPWEYQDIGTPMCADCDEDMYYLKTEMNHG